MVLKESFTDTMNHQKDGVKPEFSLEAKITKLSLYYFSHIMRIRFTRKDNNAQKTEVAGEEE